MAKKSYPEIDKLFEKMSRETANAMSMDFSKSMKPKKSVKRKSSKKKK